MIAVVSVDAYPFWHSQIMLITRIRRELVFSGCTEPADSKETKLGSSDQEVSPSAG